MNVDVAGEKYTTRILAPMAAIPASPNKFWTEARMVLRRVSSLAGHGRWKRRESGRSVEAERPFGRGVGKRMFTRR